MSQTKTVFLTGGARGIGAAILEELKGSGHTVIAPSRVELDLSCTDCVETYLATYRGGSVDILINNAGINHPQTILDISYENLIRTLQVNLSSALKLIQFFAPGMAARGSGRILNTSSIFARVTKEGRAVYSMSKAGLDALTRCVAVEFGPSGVIVNSLAPGYVDTELTRQNNSPAAMDAIVDSIPLRRMAKPEELAKVAAFLVSEENTYITGQTILADGGFTCL